MREIRGITTYKPFCCDVSIESNIFYEVNLTECAPSNITMDDNDVIKTQTQILLIC